MAGAFWVDLEVKAASLMEAEAAAETWSIEQSIEISPSVVTADIREKTLGRVDSVGKRTLGTPAAMDGGRGINAPDRGEIWAVRVVFPADLVVTDDFPIQDVLLVVLVVFLNDLGEVGDTVLKDTVDVGIREMRDDIGVTTLVLPAILAGEALMSSVVFTNLSLNNEFHNNIPS